MTSLPGGKPGAEVIARGGNNTWAPDVMRVGDKYFLYYSAPGTQPKSAIGLLVGKTLDPSSPHTGGLTPARWSGQTESRTATQSTQASFAIRPTVRCGLPTASYFGYIRLVELDPRTGTRTPAAAGRSTSRSTRRRRSIVFRDGWYYLLGTHGSCCAGANSTYSIRVGRAQRRHRPVSWIARASTCCAAAARCSSVRRGRFVGPGHFGLLDFGDGVQKFSCHYEADLDRGGRSVLDIRPLLWKDGWPVGGDNVWEGTYQIQSERSGGALELGVEFVRDGTHRRLRRPRWGAAQLRRTPVNPSRRRQLAQVAGSWPAGDIDVASATIMLRPHQKWTITPVANAGGYPGSPYFRISSPAPSGVLPRLAMAN